MQPIDIARYMLMTLALDSRVEGLKELYWYSPTDEYPAKGHRPPQLYKLIINLSRDFHMHMEMEEGNIGIG